MPAVKAAEFVLGKLSEPYLKSTTAILNSCQYVDNRLSIDISGIEMQTNETVVISPGAVKNVLLNNQILDKGWASEKIKDRYCTTIDIQMTTPHTKLDVQF
jgi:hypothetical protein